MTKLPGHLTTNALSGLIPTKPGSHPGTAAANPRCPSCNLLIAAPRRFARPLRFNSTQVYNQLLLRRPCSFETSVDSEGTLKEGRIVKFACGAGDQCNGHRGRRKVKPLEDDRPQPQTGEAVPVQKELMREGPELVCKARPHPVVRLSLTQCP